MALTLKLPPFSMRLFPLSIIIVYGLLDPARTLQISNGTETIQIFGGSLTEITCSATPLPLFRLVKEGRVHDSYDQLLDLFDIEARRSGEVVTLYINGTNRSNNVTVICRNIDAPSGQVESKILFTLMLEFISTLPAPNNVQSIEDPAGHLQILWEPPTLLSDELGSQNVSIDSRIIHFIIYISINESTTVYNASGKSFDFENDNSSCSSLTFQVAAVNPAGVGELSPPQIIDRCMDSTSVATVIERVPPSSGLPAGVIAAVIAVLVLVIAASSVTLAAITFAKLKNDRNRHDIKGLQSESSFAPEMSHLKDTPPDEEEKHSVKAAGHSGSGSVGKLNGDIDEEHASTERGRCYSQDGPPAGVSLDVYYAEINALTKRKNQTQEEDDVSRHEYAVLENTIENQNEITDADQIDACDHSRPDSQKVE